MAKTITERVVFKNATVKDLYELYMNAAKHTASTGYPASIEDKVGAEFSASGDYFTGKNLHLVRNQLIVQTWRAADWNETDGDSIFLLSLEQKGKDAILNMVHAFLPDQQAEDIKRGWTTYYWKPWKMYLEGKQM